MPAVSRAGDGGDRGPGERPRLGSKRASRAGPAAGGCATEESVRENGRRRRPLRGGLAGGGEMGSDFTRRIGVDGGGGGGGGWVELAPDATATGPPGGGGGHGRCGPRRGPVCGSGADAA